MGLVDIPCVGDADLIEQILGYDSRDISYHTPIWLKTEKVDWGPKPFRFNNVWFKHEGFNSFIKEDWAKLKIEGRGDFILYEKLKRLKYWIREWNRDVFGLIDLKVSEKVKNINELDMLLVKFFEGNVDPLVSLRREATKKLWNWINVKESMLRLKSRQLSLKDGDKNTRFFHNSMKERYRRNTITLLEGENRRVEGVEEIKDTVKLHFEI
ncbi:uncharacterized protein LOC131641157 [Vicia villosa]|uniref:uncharacterized protein LOC131641157 n=1 Tax=Vicia villosa TaxID=3911 RepID=UPI00273B9A76|nr:uncharacterized protein LOC131641157 [Vicia villosa]